VLFIWTAVAAAAAAVVLSADAMQALRDAYMWQIQPWVDRLY
jgi:hypothetical protein